MLELKIPAVGESITEVRLSKILVKSGEYAAMDQPIAEMESEKATFELNAEKSGVVHWLAEEDADLLIGAVVCKIDTLATAPESFAAPVATIIPLATTATIADPPASSQLSTKDLSSAAPSTIQHSVASPAAKKILAEANIATQSITGSGKAGRITKEDAMNAAKGAASGASNTSTASRESRFEKMSPIRKTISKRLVAAKNSTAMLTTFNEVDMSAIMDLRTKYKDKFKEKHGVALGFMSFFIKASCHALQAFPAVNAQIDEDQIQYFSYCDISIAVSTPKGLVVPIIRNAETKSIVQLEKDVMQLAAKGRDNKLSLDDMTGGTFTISNGGVFGSLMSTPIINAPQSAILGMHKIQDRPVVIDGQIVIKPMMYLAVSYDHRIIDGKESVGFLVKIKEQLENPNAMLFGEDPLKIMLEM